MRAFSFVARCPYCLRRTSKTAQQSESATIEYKLQMILMLRNICADLYSRYCSLIVTLHSAQAIIVLLITVTFGTAMRGLAGPQPAGPRPILAVAYQM